MKILTAIGNTKLRKRLLEEHFNVVFDDLQYQEAVLEILKKDREINILYLNSLLPGENDIYEFINKIIKINPNLKIIIILEKENEIIKNFLNSKNIFDIYYNNKIKIDELINLIKNNKNNNLIKIENKKIINKIINLIKLKINKIINLIKSKKNKKINLFKNKKIKINKKEESKIINIIGMAGSRKDTIYSTLSIVNK